MKKADYMTTQRSVLAAAVSEREASLAAVREDLAACARESDEYGALLLAEKSAQNRLNEANRLASAFEKDEIADLCFAHKLDFEPIVSERKVNTREFKQRFLRCVNAILFSNPDYLRADEYLTFGAIAAGRLKTDGMSLKQMQGVMNHQGTTQARYFRDFLAYFGAVPRDAKTEFSVDAEAPFVKKVLSLFG